MIVSKNHLQTYRQAGKISTKILEEVMYAVKPGVFPYSLDQLAGKLCEKHQVEPAFAKVGGKNGPYGYAMCISVNDTVVHGIPSQTEALAAGDVVKLDFGIIHQGLYTDFCVTVGVEKLSKANMKLVRIAKESVLSAVNIARAGLYTGDLGQAMHHTASQHGFDVVKQYIGHGIGESLHDDPPIPAYGRPGSGALLRSGMALCLEAQVVPGSDRVYVADDDWTVKTVDKKNSAMFEYLVIIGDGGAQVLTDTRNWPLVV